MIDELEREAGLELHDAWLRRLVVDLATGEMALEVDAYRVGAEETVAARVVFAGVQRLSWEDVALAGAGGQRIDVGEDADGALWVFLSESNGFIRLRAESVSIESAVGRYDSRTP